MVEPNWRQLSVFYDPIELEGVDQARAIKHIQRFAARAKITLLEKRALVFECQACKAKWSPSVRREKLVKGWEKCPNGCNAGCRLFAKRRRKAT